jgi:hypothetical protein
MSKIKGEMSNQKDNMIKQLEMLKHEAERARDERDNANKELLQIRQQHVVQEEQMKMYKWNQINSSATGQQIP